MTAKIIDGTAIAEQVRAELSKEVEARLAAGLSRPGLATVLVGENPASHSYVRMKQKACEKVGIKSFGQIYPADITQSELEKVVGDLNASPEVNGILVQLPLPKGLDEERVLTPSASKRTWMAFTRSISVAWRRKAASPCSCPAPPSVAFTCSNRPVFRSMAQRRLCWVDRISWACRLLCSW